MNRSVLRGASVALVVLASSMICFAKAPKIDPSKGEGNWGIDGAPIVTVSNVSRATLGEDSSTEAYEGRIKNVSKDAINEITVTGGEHKDGSAIVYGATALHAKLLPGETWNFEIRRADDTRFEVLRISVGANDLTQITP
jgi:hypothetical protein